MTEANDDLVEFEEDASTGAFSFAIAFASKSADSTEDDADSTEDGADSTKDGADSTEDGGADSAEDDEVVDVRQH